MNTRATLHGRALARNGAVTLDSNTIDPPACTTGASAPGPGGRDPGRRTRPGAVPPGGAVTSPRHGVAARQAGAPDAVAATPGTGTRSSRPSLRSVGRTVVRFGRTRCVERTFRAVVTGVRIRSSGSTSTAAASPSQDRAPFAATIRMHRGIHKLRARVSFSDGTRARNVGFRFRPCAPVARSTPSFTG